MGDGAGECVPVGTQETKSEGIFSDKYDTNMILMQKCIRCIFSLVGHVMHRSDGSKIYLVCIIV